MHIRRILGAVLTAGLILPSLPAFASGFMPLSQEAVQEEESLIENAYIGYLEKGLTDRHGSSPTAVDYADFAGKAYSFGRTDLAEEYALLALKAKDDDATLESASVYASTILSFIASSRGDADKAVGYGEAAVKADSTDWMGYYALGHAFHKTPRQAVEIEG